MIRKEAFADPGPICFKIFSTTGSSVIAYFSVNSFSTSQVLASMIEIILSVIFSLVPCGIVKFTETRSLAIDGKKVPLIIPP